MARQALMTSCDPSKPTLVDDPLRLDLLASYHILDTLPEEGFDDIVQLAKDICDTPIALVSLVAQDRQWFKARLGLDVSQTPIDQSVCAHALGRSDLLVIPDLRLDARTSHNTLVTEAPHLRFYAGTPLRASEGLDLGTLCVIDTEPRPQGLRPNQASALAALGRQIVRLLELRRVVEARDEALVLRGTSEANLRTILETVPVGIIFAEAPSGRIVGGNAKIEEITGHPVLKSATLAEYRQWVSYHADGRRVEAHEYPLARVLAEDVDEAMLQVQYERRDGTRLWIEIVGAAIRDADGVLKGGVAAIADIDARIKADATQSLMNLELSHRMKNQLAMVQAIMVQSLRGATSMEAARDVIGKRLVALGKAHDILLEAAGGRTPIEMVVRGGVGVHDDEGDSHFIFSGPMIEIGGKPSLSLALMLHELSTNATKYGALSVPDGHVAISWSLDDTGAEPMLRLEWREHGGPPVIAPAKKGFGSRLIERGLTGTVGGTVVMTFVPTGLTCVVEAALRGFQRED